MITRQKTTHDNLEAAKARYHAAVGSNESPTVYPLDNGYGQLHRDYTLAADVHHSSYTGPECSP